MTNTQIIIAVIAVAVVSFTGFGLMRAAIAHGNHASHSSGKMYRTHMFSKDAWKDEEKLQEYRTQCKEKGAHKLEHFIQGVHDRLELTADQQGKWQELNTAIQTEAATVNQICDKIFTQENLTDTPARLELMTVVMAMGTESLQRLQPYVNGLYQSLNAQQKSNFDEMLSHRRHRHWF